MRLERFERLTKSDEELIALQDRLEDFFRQFEENPLMQGVTLDGTNKAGDPPIGIELTTTKKYIDHKLGRNPTGYIITRKDANADVYESTYINAEQKTRQLSLIATAPVTVCLWVF